MNFEDFKSEWLQAQIGSPPYINIILKDGSRIFANKYEYSGEKFVIFLRGSLDDENHITYPIQIALVELDSIYHIYNPWSHGATIVDKSNARREGAKA